MTTLYVITRLLTFIGSANRAFLEHLVCRLCKIPAEDIRAFRNDELCGHIEHELSPKLSHNFLMCWLPFTVNFVLGSLILLSGSFMVFYIGAVSATSIGFLWVGFALVCNCAPSYEDVLMFKDSLYKGKNKFLKVILSPFFALVYACALLERFSITFVLAIGYAIILPNVVTVAFPVIHTVVQMFV